MVKVPSFHFDTDQALADVLREAFFIMDAGDIAATLGDDAGDFLELARPVYDLDRQAEGAAGV